MLYISRYNDLAMEIWGQWRESVHGRGAEEWKGTQDIPPIKMIETACINCRPHHDNNTKSFENVTPQRHSTDTSRYLSRASNPSSTHSSHHPHP